MGGFLLRTEGAMSSLVVGPRQGFVQRQRGSVPAKTDSPQNYKQRVLLVSYLLRGCIQGSCFDESKGWGTRTAQIRLREAKRLERTVVGIVAGTNSSHSLYSVSASISSQTCLMKTMLLFCVIRSTVRVSHPLRFATLCSLKIRKWRHHLRSPSR